MGSRIIDLCILKTARQNVMEGTYTIFLPSGLTLTYTQFSDSLRAYFKAFGQKITIAKITDDEVYIRLEEHRI